MKPGTIQTLEVIRKIDTGYVLEGDVLLHHNETENELEHGQQVEVFLYTDKKGKTVASGKVPFIQMDHYGWANVVDVIPGLGVFVDIGTTKEILVSIDDLPLFERVWPINGDKLFVTLGHDRKGRLLAIPGSENAFDHLWETASEDLLNKSVNGRIYRTSKEGAAVITENHHRGFIHHTERKTEPRLGELVHGRIIDVKDDGSINISLRPLKKESRIEDADSILMHLEQNGGVVPFTDKSEPEDIRGTFNISKAAFKRALGKLMKDGKIEQREGNTYLKK
ncbi:CvfB family protein [Virgibacillus siamensis]|uniref:CvfB family protein n=1 Tax=Virgibacillus siamensis TaxID=480071 RepID=UPI000984927C|nr:S1-like domain-containing RNA-binding protein [Virgibacillus siamensis]